MMILATSSKDFSVGSFAITEQLQISADGGVDLFGFGHLLIELCGQLGHLLLEGDAVVFDLLGTDVAARSEDVAVGLDLLERGALAEGGDVLVFARLLLATLKESRMQQYMK